jgi:arabinofuranosyltransferase
MVFPTTPRRRFFSELLVALVVTLTMAAVSWFLGGAPGTNGIDDAAITRSYSDNLANGHGFVYNIGGERVEGATSFLWTMILVLPYLFGENPETAILTITTFFTVMAVFFGLRISRRAAAGLHPTATVFLMAAAMAGLPAYFIWSVWSMMEVALWSALCMLLLDRLSHLAEETEITPRVDTILLAAAFTLPITRPEGIVVAFGMGLLAVALRPVLWRPVGLALIAAVVSFCAIALARLTYFGFPFPNTYYAKVSSDRLQNIIDGAKYLMSFVSGHPFAEVIFVSWILLGIISVVGLIRNQASGQRTQVLAAALVLGILSIYVLLGGDHFALWRFYQPIMPILPLPLVLLALWFVRITSGRGRIAIVSLALGFWLVINNIAYHQERFRIAREFQLSHRGEVFGTYLNEFSPRPSMGVVAAGGIALTYEGELRDLMGLNWVEMAHANPIKIGFRNHASFDVDTFWKHETEILPQFHKPGCQRDGWTEKTNARDTGVKQLFGQPQFQAKYTPIIMEMDGGKCTNAFAANTWLDTVQSDRIRIVGWDNLTLTEN